MRRFFKIAIPVFILGFIAGNAFWYLFSPLWIDRVVSETLPTELALTTERSGEFYGADAAHRGSGKAQILKSPGGKLILRFSDFSVTNGPDLEVWLVKAAEPKASADVTASEWISLDQLKGNKGNQNYTIPDGSDISQYNSAAIWCEQFGVLFAAASLK